MKITARIASAVTATVAAIASVFIAAPAFAHEEVEKFNPADEFSTVNDPMQVGAIIIVGIILLAIVLIGAQLVGNLFEKK